MTGGRGAANVRSMTTTDTKDATVAAHKLACVLATIHTAFLAEQDELVSTLLNTLPIALDDPDVHPFYYSEGVDEFLRVAGNLLHSGTEDLFGILAPEEEDESLTEEEEELKSLLQFLMGDEFDEDDFRTYLAEEKAEGGTCDDPECVCNDLPEDDGEFDPSEAEAWGEVLHEDDEYVILKFKK